MSGVFFTSDLHLGHERAARERGYARVSDHDDAVIYTLKAQTDKNCVIWILGDVAMTIEAIDRLRVIPAKKRLIFGNHDNFDLGVYQKYFYKIHGFLKYKEYWLSHAPIHPQEFYRMKLNIHGHLHKNTESPNLGYPYLNVNWDYWGRALSLDEVKAYSHNNEHLQDEPGYSVARRYIP